MSSITQSLTSSLMFTAILGSVGPALAGPIDIEQRDYPVPGGPAPNHINIIVPCFTGDSDYNYINALSENGNAVANMCFWNNTGGQKDYHPPVMTQADVDVAKCIADLHHDQNDACITVKGSRCDTNDYTKNGGLISAGEMTGDGQNHCGPPDGNGCRLDADQASSIKAAMDTMVGQSVNLGVANPYIVTYSTKDFNPDNNDASSAPSNFFQYSLGPKHGC